MAVASDRDSILSLITNQQDGLRDLWQIVDRLGENFKQILQSISSDERLKILQIGYKKNGMTILHYAVYKSDAEMVEMLLDCVSEDDERYILLSAQARDSCTPIHIACVKDNSTVLPLLIRLLKEEKWYKILQITIGGVVTPLSLSALYGHTQAISTIASSLTAQHLHVLHLLRNIGTGPLQLAELCGEHAAASLLKDYKTKALIDVALQQTDRTGSICFLVFQFLLCTSTVSNSLVLVSLIIQRIICMESDHEEYAGKTDCWYIFSWTRGRVRSCF